MPGSRGRPSLIHQVVRVTPDGTQVTAAEQVVTQIRLGLDLAVAADSAGIARNTLHQWTLRGARARAVAARTGRAVPAAERPYSDFADAVERAHAEAEANRLAIINRAAMGGAVVTKVTVKRGPVPEGSPEGTQGPVIERTEVTETLRPEWTAAAWWLERKRGYIKTVEVTGAGGAPLVPQAEAARDLADSLREYLQGVEDGKAAAAKAGAPRARKAPTRKAPADAT